MVKVIKNLKNIVLRAINRIRSMGYTTEINTTELYTAELANDNLHLEGIMCLTASPSVVKGILNKEGLMWILDVIKYLKNKSIYKGKSQLAQCVLRNEVKRYNMKVKYFYKSDVMEVEYSLAEVVHSYELRENVIELIFLIPADKNVKFIEYKIFNKKGSVVYSSKCKLEVVFTEGSFIYLSISWGLEDSSSSLPIFVESIEDLT